VVVLVLEDIWRFWGGVWVVMARASEVSGDEAQQCSLPCEWEYSCSETLG
jgi:hypothetical protein